MVPCCLSTEGQGEGKGVVLEVEMRNKSRTHVFVEVMATLELTAVCAQLIVTDGTGILTAGLARKGTPSYLKISN